MSRVTKLSSTYLILLLFLIGGVLSAEPWEKSLRWGMDRFGVAQEDQITFIRVIEQAEQNGIPADVLIPRIEEGVAKNIPVQRIVAVVEREMRAYSKAKKLIIEHGELEQASSLLNNTPLWTRTATLLLQKVSDETVSELLSIFASSGTGEQRWESYRYGTSLYTALTEWGMKEQESLRIIKVAAASSIPSDEYKGILDVIISGTAFRVSPSQMVDRIEQVGNRVSTIEELQDYVWY